LAEKRTNLRRSTLGSGVFTRRLKVYFYTSNLEKLLQARLLFQNQGQSLNHFRAYREPYEEDYTLDKNDLLRNAINQVRNQFLVRSIFFVEDTSIRIEALSDEIDYPGLRAKEWFAETGFNELDILLEEAGDDRRATVKSDIAIHIPNLEDVFFFHGETHGTVAKHPPSFEPNPVYPWLTPTTFNGWFIPDGETTPLGALSFERSAAHDFRGKALTDLLDFIRPLNAAANLPSSFFAREQRPPTSNPTEPYLPHIFDALKDNAPTVICIIGHKCSGKTTASEFVQSSFGVRFFEASEQLRAIARDMGIEVNSSASAMSFLEEQGYDIVAQQIIEQLDEDASQMVVISGLRTVEELDLIYRSHSNVLTLLISADRRIRFERHVRRGRDPDVQTPEQFLELDSEQLGFGLLSVAEEISNVIIVNESDLPSYYNRVNSAVEATLFSKKESSATFSSLSELHRSLIALSELGRVSSCEDISSETERLGSKVWRYNTNRALKSVPLFVDRHDHGEKLLSYRVNERGEQLLRLLNRRRQYLL